MDVFDLRNDVVRDYAEYVQSFVTIRDPRIRSAVEEEFASGLLWPEPLIQLNPAFQQGPPLQDLVDDGTLHPEALKIFRKKDRPTSDEGPLRLHQHQVEGIRAAKERENYVLTTGTGSGKSLAYMVPIVDHVLRNGSGRGIQAIIVYPMNALANSQLGELEKFLHHGYPAGQSPVTFQRYTGQESFDREERDQGEPAGHPAHELRDAGADPDAAGRPGTRARGRGAEVPRSGRAPHLPGAAGRRRRHARAADPGGVPGAGPPPRRHIRHAQQRRKLGGTAG